MGVTPAHLEGICACATHAQSSAGFGHNREKLTPWLGLNIKGNATLRKTSKVVTTGAILLLSL